MLVRFQQFHNILCTRICKPRCLLYSRIRESQFIGKIRLKAKLKIEISVFRTAPGFNRSYQIALNIREKRLGDLLFSTINAYHIK